MKFFKVLVVASLVMAQHSIFAETKKTEKVQKSKKEAVQNTTPKIQILKADGESGKDIIEVAKGSKDHSTLVAAIEAAGLVETLQGPGPYTVFAPTNAAFDKLPKETVPNLLKPENKKSLVSVLEHHTAAPRVNPEVLLTLPDLDMVDGPKLKIENKEGRLIVEGQEIKTAIIAKNGIIYIIDKVLTP